MSLLPFLIDLDEYDPWPRRHHHHYRRNPLSDFGLGINQRDLHQLLAMPSEFRQLEQRARDLQHRAQGNFTPAPVIGKDGFQVCIDVQQFSPNEINVKTIENQVIVEGKHEERQDEHGFISRQFSRRYLLPKGYDSNSVSSTLSSDGVLTIKAPPPQKALTDNERVVTIQQTGPARLNVKENEAVEDKKSGDN